MAIGSSKRRMNAAEQAERQWAANSPADYVNQNKEAMDAVTGQVGSGFDWNTAADAYQQYRQRATQSAQAAADNAKANAVNLGRRVWLQLCRQRGRPEPAAGPGGH